MFQSLRQRFPWRPSPLIIAVTLSLLLILWLASGEQREARETAPEQPEQAEEGLPQVEVRWSNAEPLPQELLLQGTVLAWHQVELRAQVAGRVEALLKQQGDEVAAGEPLLRLSDEGRDTRLAQARADLRLRQNELQGAKSLKSGNLISETELARLESEYARAQADLAAAELAAEYSEPKAPFAGRVDRRHVDIGALVQPGEPLMTLVDVSRLRVTGQIPQQRAGGVVIGQAVRVTLLDGRELQGAVSFVSLAADAATRSFYVEAHVANPELWRVAGASATLRIEQPALNAHRVTPALLSLGASGEMGIHAVDDTNKVVFHPLRVISIDGDGAVVAGLPGRMRLITQGAGFVRPGEEVDPRGAAE